MHQNDLKPGRLTALLLLLAVTATPVLAQEPPLSWNAKDRDLKWGPCPPLLPKGCGIAVLHGDPAKNNVDIFLRLPPGSRIPRHWHTSVERMVLVAGEMHVVYDGHPRILLKPGTYAYGPAKLPHEAECRKGATCVLFIAFEQPVDAVAADGEPKK